MSNDKEETNRINIYHKLLYYILALMSIIFFDGILGIAAIGGWIGVGRGFRKDGKSDMYLIIPILMLLLHIYLVWL